MTLNEIRERVLFQTNNDSDDLGDFQPHIEGYINEGYDLLTMAYDRIHVNAEKNGDVKYPSLVNASDTPTLPEWMHPALADFATYMIYRNGNALKQNRGMAFWQMFQLVLQRARTREDETHYQRNLYVDMRTVQR